MIDCSLPVVLDVPTPPPLSTSCRIDASMDPAYLCMECFGHTSLGRKKQAIVDN